MISKLIKSAVCAAFVLPFHVVADERPNIVYIALEDITPMFGCYGDRDAKTPNFDRLAEEGIRYTRAYSGAPVCSASRSSIVSGMYASTIGTVNHRSRVALPAFLKLIPEFFRDAGYYTCNNYKQDYNFRGIPWDDCSHEAHYRNRPDKSKPFFAKFDFRESHSSLLAFPEEDVVAERLNRLRPEDFHDPAKVFVPPYHPDDPLFRRFWGRYHDAVTQCDYRTGELIAQLKEDGLWDDTIVFVWADHGVGIPRGKLTCWEQGFHVPLIVRFPEKYQHLAPAAPGTAVHDLVLLMDMGPSAMKMVGIEPPDWMQGRPLLCKGDVEKREFVVGGRNRINSPVEMVRSVRDERYRYQRNFYTHLPYRPFYADETAMTYWFELARDGKLTGDLELMARRFKPVEELYDSESDPHMVHNVADNPNYAEVLKQMRTRLDDWMLETRDIGLIEETQSVIGARKAGSPWDYVQSIDNYRDILEAAELQLEGLDAVARFRERATDPDPNIRHQGIVGLLLASQSAGPEMAEGIKHSLRTALNDKSISVRLAAADGLCNYGEYADALPALIAGLNHPESTAKSRAANILCFQPPEANDVLREALGVIATAIGKTTGKVRAAQTRARAAISGQRNFYRWGPGASGNPENSLMVVQQRQFGGEEKRPSIPPDTVLIDFGNPAPAHVVAKGYNNMGAAALLADYDAGRPGIGLVHAAGAARGWTLSLEAPTRPAIADARLRLDLKQEMVEAVAKAPRAIASAYSFRSWKDGIRIAAGEFILAFGNLDAGKTYDLLFFGARAKDPQKQTWSVVAGSGGNADQTYVQSSVVTDMPVRWTGVKPDAAGVIRIKIGVAGDYGALSFAAINEADQ